MVNNINLLKRRIIFQNISLKDLIENESNRISFFIQSNRR